MKVCGNRYFNDREREINARMIEYTMKKGGESGLFTTLTFKNEVSEKRAERLCDRWLARTQQSLLDKGGHSLKSICATEWQKRGVIHYHLLLIGNGLGKLSRKKIESRWEAMGGGFARCYDAEGKVAPYLAKYTSKSLAGDLKLGGTWRGLRFPASIERVQTCAPTDTV